MNNNLGLTENKKERMANLELLRCIAMMMVVVLHYLGKGGLLGEMTAGKLSAVNLTAWVIECFSVVAVNVYMLISGYFLCESAFKLSRLVKLWLQVWFYSVGVGLLAAFTGICPAEEVDLHYFITLIFPISMDHYWFMTAYVFLYLLLPFVSIAVQKMTKGQMQVVLTALLIMFCGVKSVLPVRLQMDMRGYDVLWYLCVFLTAAYLKKYGIPALNKRWKCVGLYVLCSLGILAETMCFHQIYLRTGSFELIMNVATNYNHIFPFLASIGLFLTFLTTKVSGVVAKIVTRIAPYTLGVYLLHENTGVRYLWQDWLWADKVTGIPGLIIGTLIALVIVFALGILVDMTREIVMRNMHRLLMKAAPYRKLADWLEGSSIQEIS